MRGRAMIHIDYYAWTKLKARCTCWSILNQQLVVTAG